MPFSESGHRNACVLALGAEQSREAIVMSDDAWAELHYVHVPIMGYYVLKDKSDKSCRCRVLKVDDSIVHSDAF